VAEIPPLRIDAGINELMRSFGLEIARLHDVELSGSASDELFVITYTGNIFIHPREGVVKGTACVCTCEHTSKESQT
jgi:hypothetical protein